ncbi:MAG: SET domain-containing protein [Rhodospirillaceae bacterium]|jgi:SET domain-containing protein
MMLIPTYVRGSGIHGIGIFAGREIKKGEQVWTFDPVFDHIISDKAISYLDPTQATFLETYAYRDQWRNNALVLESDNGRFMNHSSDPNCDFTNGDGFAARHIEQDEELTCDYAVCCVEYLGRVDFGIETSVWTLVNVPLSAMKVKNSPEAR